MSARKRGPGPLAETFGHVARGLRTQQQRTLTEVAASAGLDTDRLKKIEEAREEPTLEEIFQIARGLGLSAARLLEHVEDAGVQP